MALTQDDVLYDALKRSQNFHDDAGKDDVDNKGLSNGL